MFDLPSIRVGRAFGIPVEINASWIVIFALVAFSLSTGVFPSIAAAQGAPWWLFLIVGSLTALLFFASILAHELCHSLVARASGGHVERITLFLFGGVAQIDEEPGTPRKEFLMASAGPAMSFVLSGLCFGGFVAAATYSAPWWIWAPLQYLAGINLLVAVFNLLPGFPLDGGRVLRSVLWGITGDLLKATLWASRAGQFIGWSMAVGAVLGVLRGRVDLIWFGVIGWFIASLAGNAYRQQAFKSRIEGVLVGQVMSASPEYVDGDLSLEQLANEYFLGRRHSRYPVLHNGSIVGIVTLPDLKTVDRPDWAFVRAIDVAHTDLSALVVAADATVESVVERLAGDVPGMLLVASSGRLAGVITRSDVLHLVETR
ncbi:MAG: CBS domain-containing protein [Actinobacteria bacterium]|nr:MAG: CBS domain-containing protein [Actinomycetota bacterium]